MGNIPDWLNGWKMDGPTLMFNMYLKAKLRTFMKLVTTALFRLAPRRFASVVVVVMGKMRDKVGESLLPSSKPFP